MQIDHQRAALRYQNKVNNAQGHFFEQAIKAACALYASHGRATADKTPEPFRVLEKSRDGIFKGRFTARFRRNSWTSSSGGSSNAAPDRTESRRPHDDHKNFRLLPL